MLREWWQKRDNRELVFVLIAAFIGFLLCALAGLLQ
jgi:hypothetical protein